MIILIFIIGLAFLIIIHEFGHFLAAKLVNIEVEEFGIGFPPRAAKLFNYKGTDFTLNWIPLGGFVKPKGENNPDEEGGLAAASPWARLFVLTAGPAMNLLAGVIIFAAIFFRLGGPDFKQVLVVSVPPNSPAETAGITPGDIVQEVNGVSIDGTSQLSATIQSNLDKSINITLVRGEETILVTAIPSSSRSPEEGALGIMMGNPTKQLNAWESLYFGGWGVYRNVEAILALPGRLISGSVAPEQGRIVGYKGMVDILGEMQERDAAEPTELAGINTLSFFGAITVSLGLLNLFPFPALDGGRIIFVLPEIVFRRRVPANFENVVHLVGFAFLMIVLIYVNLQDFINPIIIP